MVLVDRWLQIRMGQGGDVHRQLLGGQVASDQNRTGGMHVGNLLVDRWPEIIIEQGQCVSVTYWWTGGVRSESDRGDVHR